ncbi:hypothetical protein [Longispora albida]|uniref:hypothetical protein n=1 Tax=Longispora albida TaxID=203523 RepID=UPI00036C745F|nr:hypothetical protein [Longispora albida]
MATERVNLTMDQTALAAARSMAAAEGQSLSEWLSKAALERVMAHAARVSAEQDRLMPEEFAGFDAEREARMFGEAA